MLNKKLDFIKRIDNNFIALYVEDNEEVQQQTLKMLGKMLPNILCASNGEEGFDKYNNYHLKNQPKKIDLIITDIQMPKQDGLEMIQRIRKSNKEIPIIIFSAYDNTDYFMKAIRLGIDGYILKPYPIEQISEVLNDVITKHYDIKNIVMFEKDYMWDKNNKILQQKNQIIRLTKNESSLIQFLVSNNQSIKPLESIENYIFDDFIYNERRVRNIIARLNNKLDINIIESIYGQGFKITSI